MRVIQIGNTKSSFASREELISTSSDKKVLDFNSHPKASAVTRKDIEKQAFKELIKEALLID